MKRTQILRHALTILNGFFYISQIPHYFRQFHLGVKPRQGSAQVVHLPLNCSLSQKYLFDSNKLEVTSVAHSSARDGPTANYAPYNLTCLIFENNFSLVLFIIRLLNESFVLVFNSSIGFLTVGQLCYQRSLLLSF